MIKSILYISVIFLTVCGNSENPSFVLSSNEVQISEGTAVDFKGTENIVFLPENRSTTKTRTTGIQ